MIPENIDPQMNKFKAVMDDSSRFYIESSRIIRELQKMKQHAQHIANTNFMNLI